MKRLIARAVAKQLAVQFYFAHRHYNKRFDSTANRLMRFSSADLAKAFDPRYLLRGKQYWQQHRVQHFAMHDEAGGTRIVAEVRGSSNAPYTLQVVASDAGHGTIFNSQCSCPLGGDCKHVIAALFEACNRWQREKPRAVEGSADLPQEVREWLARLSEPALANSAATVQRKRLLYVLEQSRSQRSIVLMLYSVRLLKDGQPSTGSLERYQNADFTQRAPPRFIDDSDQELLRALLPYRGRGGEHELQGRAGAHLLHLLLDSGRCYWEKLDGPPLRLGAMRNAEPQWFPAEDGSQRLGLKTTPPASGLLALAPPWYVDAASGECGPLRTSLAPHRAAALVDAPLLPVHWLPQVAQQLTRADAPLPAPSLRALRSVKDIAPQPILLFYGREVGGHLRYGPHARLGAAQLLFGYRNRRVAAHDTLRRISVDAGDEILQIERNHATERGHIKELSASGLLVPAHSVLQPWEIDGIGRDDYTVASGARTDETWSRFMLEVLPGLAQKGWKIEYDDTFPHRFAEVEEWFGGVEEATGNDWFTLEMGVMVQGERVNLLPILAQFLHAHPQDFSRAALKARPPDAQLVAALPDGRRIALPYARIAPILLTLIELYDGQPLEADGTLRLSRLDALRLAELQAANDAAQTRWFGGEKLLVLGQRLRDFDGIAAVVVPAGLTAQLRPYQQQGLGWLQFLREYGFGGILADDMGLGKTVQTLAHILLEKESGRLNRPALVVAPTSLVGNWQREARQFAPDLRVLALHGLQRKQHFSALAEHDLVITTYPLLSRDKNVLSKQTFHILVLDEAQNIKNARSLAAQMVQQIEARHRLCLTGTPMENHLGELWSQFHFLQPGLLGDDRQFRRLYRTPIEKQGDVERMAHLTRRIAPFILRRSKQQVARELPPKTEIVRSVALAGAQRDLYETLRLAMHEKVRHEIAGRGLARSHIIILDALLKLRQACCDPRLLKLESARRAHGVSAKLELLMTLLSGMVEEGRRILLFSQFTSMLALIEDELNARGIRYLKLTGESQNRGDIVDQFQDGSVPVFLVSLKAGGVGLNLTAADTVIHYDPWWNPAAENQATDRAHRIGQDKPVFVYKLIVEGSVEEKILAMQQRKAQLAAGVLDGHAADASDTGAAFNTQDLQALFEPLEG
ncbi:MAG: SNF2-related protein [Stenotrophobium sp.]